MKVYLDNHTTSRPSLDVVEAMRPFFREFWGTTSSPHQMGYEILSPLKNAIKSIYKLIGAKEEDHFVFTSSGAEAINHVIFAAYIDITRKTGKNHFVTSVMDEAPQILAMERLQELGCVHQLAPVTNGKITIESISKSITPRTALVSLSWVNGMTGVINPLKEISLLCKERGILFHVDATHMLGKSYYEWEDSGADIITFNGEQIQAPKGSGGLFFRDGIELSPLILGGNEQELRGGNLNVPGLVGLGKAAEIAYEAKDYYCTEIARLRMHFEQLLLQSIPEVSFFFQNELKIPHIVVANFPGVTSDALLYLLSKKGIYASLGGGNFQHIENLLRAAGQETHCALSFALSQETTENEIERAVEKIQEAYLKLKKCSLHLMKEKLA